MAKGSVFWEELNAIPEHERPKLVQSGPLPLDVLLEGERELGALLELAPEDDERAEGEATKQRIEMRRASGHGFGYVPGRPTPAPAPSVT